MRRHDQNGPSGPEAPGSDESPKRRVILYCHCAYAKIIKPEVKKEVLDRLSASGAAFEAVPDLCEMSARKDPSLERLAQCEELRIAACFPRAVKWLFHSAGAPLGDGRAEVLNMREQSAREVASRLVELQVEEVSP